MKRVLVIGNSHAGTLRSANGLFLARKDIAVDWLVTPANTRFEVAAGTGRVGPPPAYADHPSAGAMKAIGHRGAEAGIVLTDYDALLYSAVGIRPPELVRDHPVFELADRPTSDALLRALFCHHGSLGQHHRNIAGFRAGGFGGTILCESWLRPCRLPPGVSRAQWERACDAEARVVAQMLAPEGAVVLGHLPDCEHLTGPELVRDPEVPNVHGNADYARRLVAAALAVIADL
jgi:hypothetical protein